MRACLILLAVCAGGCCRPDLPLPTLRNVSLTVGSSFNPDTHDVGPINFGATFVVDGKP